MDGLLQKQTYKQRILKRIEREGCRAAFFLLNWIEPSCTVLRNKV